MKKILQGLVFKKENKKEQENQDVYNSFFSKDKSFFNLNYLSNISTWKLFKKSFKSHSVSSLPLMIPVFFIPLFGENFSIDLIFDCLMFGATFFLIYQTLASTILTGVFSIPKILKKFYKQPLEDNLIIKEQNFFEKFLSLTTINFIPLFFILTLISEFFMSYTTSSPEVQGANIHFIFAVGMASGIYAGTSALISSGLLKIIERFSKDKKDIKNNTSINDLNFSMKDKELTLSLSSDFNQKEKEHNS